MVGVLKPCLISADVIPSNPGASVFFKLVRCLLIIGARMLIGTILLVVIGGEIVSSSLIWAITLFMPRRLEVGLRITVDLPYLLPCWFHLRVEEILYV